MMTLVAFVLVYVVLGIANADKVETPQNKFSQKQTQHLNRIIGVSSVAGITSRNGRVSSLGGVKFFGPESVGVNLKSDPAYYYPVTISAEKDGRFASGSVSVYPESRGVSASASAGYIPPGSSATTYISNGASRASAYIPSPSSATYFPTAWSATPEFFITPSAQMFDFSNTIDPWFPKDNLFGNFVQPKMDVMRNNWVYPSFNPFVNFWR